MTTLEHVLQEALSLSPEDRSLLVDRIDESLKKGEFASAAVAAAWTAEIDRRIAAFERGEAQSSDAESAIERMRLYLAEHRRRRSTS
jgi:putative addiction module component (TIGR02574 family)